MSKTTNIVQFTDDRVDLVLELDPKTLRDLDMLAEHRGITRDQMIEEAVDEHQDVLKIGETLLLSLEKELAVCGQARKRFSIQFWIDQIERIATTAVVD